jgi:hypothetical protein
MCLCRRRPDQQVFRTSVPRDRDPLKDDRASDLQEKLDDYRLKSFVWVIDPRTSAATRSLEDGFNSTTGLRTKIPNLPVEKLFD